MPNTHAHTATNTHTHTHKHLPTFLAGRTASSDYDKAGQGPMPNEHCTGGSTTREEPQSSQLVQLISQQQLQAATSTQHQRNMETSK